MRYFDYYEQIKEITNKYIEEAKDGEERRKIEMMWDIIETTSDWFFHHTLF